MSIYTREYGTWPNFTTSLTPEISIGDLLGEHASSYDVSALTSAYRMAINETLPPQCVLAGKVLYGPADMYADEMLDSIRDAIDSVDLADIAKRHQLCTTSDVVDMLGLTGKGSARTTLRRWRVAPVDRLPGKDSQSRYRLCEVEAAAEYRPGRGRVLQEWQWRLESARNIQTLDHGTLYAADIKSATGIAGRIARLGPDYGRVTVLR